MKSQQFTVMTSIESYEYYTPEYIIDLVRAVMGCIDLDPASCEFAQRTVKANKYYTKEEDGLTRKWGGRVFVNPPYSEKRGTSLAAIWATYLIDEYESKRVKEACILVKSAFGYGWYEALKKKLLGCVIEERISFYRANGSDEGKSKIGNTMFYLGPNGNRFIRVFRDVGGISLPKSITDELAYKTTVRKLIIRKLDTRP